MAPRWPHLPQDGPKMAEGGHNLAQDGAKLAHAGPRRFQIGQRQRQDGPHMAPQLNPGGVLPRRYILDLGQERAVLGVSAALMSGKWCKRPLHGREITNNYEIGPYFKLPYKSI